MIVSLLELLVCLVQIETKNYYRTNHHDVYEVKYVW